MGKRSIKENKNIYQTSRENLNYTREKAAEQLQFISADRIEKIESEKTFPHPDEVLQMSKVYKTPNLCNYFCTHECPIGIECMDEIAHKDLSQITLEILSSLNALEKTKNRFIDITVDGTISEDEFKDFIEIQAELKHIANTVSSLSLWVDETISSGKIDKAKLDSYLNHESKTI